MIDYQDAKQVAGVFAAVAQETRLQILHRLAQEPHHVGKLAESIGLPMVNISHHLGILRQAGIVEDAKDGRRVVYAFRPGVFAPGDRPGVVGTLEVGTVKMVLRDDTGPIPAANTGRRRPARP